MASTWDRKTCRRATRGGPCPRARSSASPPTTDGQVEAAAGEPVDYVAIGPVFPTRTKADARPAVGLDGVRSARARTRLPLVAIGGITADNARAVIEAGADGVAVLSAVPGRRRRRGRRAPAARGRRGYGLTAAPAVRPEPRRGGAAGDAWSMAVAAAAALLPHLAAVLPLRSYYFRDFTVTFYPLRLFQARELASGRWPFWNPYVQEGTFALPVSYPLDLLHVFWPGPAAVSWLLTLHFPLAAVAAHWLARELGASRRAAAAGRSAVCAGRAGGVVSRSLRLPPGPRAGAAGGGRYPPGGRPGRPIDRRRRGGARALADHARAGVRPPGRAAGRCSWDGPRGPRRRRSSG